MLLFSWHRGESIVRHAGSPIQQHAGGSLAKRLRRTDIESDRRRMTGSVPRKKDNPGVPVTPSEQIESTHQSFDAGPSFVHIHVRKPDETPASDRILFAQVQEGVRKHCP